MGHIGAKLRKVQAFISSYRECYVFNLTDLEAYKGKPVRIQLEDNYPVFRRPYKLSLLEREEGQIAV